MQDLGILTKIEPLCFSYGNLWVCCHINGERFLIHVINEHNTTASSLNNTIVSDFNFF